MKRLIRNLKAGLVFLLICVVCIFWIILSFFVLANLWTNSEAGVIQWVFAVLIWGFNVIGLGELTRSDEFGMD